LRVLCEKSGQSKNTKPLRVFLHRLSQSIKVCPVQLRICAKREDPEKRGEYGYAAQGKDKNRESYRKSDPQSRTGGDRKTKWIEKELFRKREVISSAKSRSRGTGVGRPTKESAKSG